MLTLMIHTSPRKSTPVALSSARHSIRFEEQKKYGTTSTPWTWKPTLAEEGTCCVSRVKARISRSDRKKEGDATQTHCGGWCASV